MKKILLLTTSDRPSEYTKNIKSNLEEDLDVLVDIHNLEDIYASVIDGVTQVAFPSGKLNEYSLVYIKHWHAFEEAALVVSSYCQTHEIPVFPSETVRIVSKTKFAETLLLALNNLPVPDSLFFFDCQAYTQNFSVVEDELRVPFIFKAIDGKKGANNHLIASKEQLRMIVEEDTSQKFIAQQFIDNDGDYRIINFGDELRIAIYRTRTGDTHLNNTSQGGDGSLVPLDSINKNVLEDCLNAAKVLDREISGIDVVIGKDLKHYIFEVNYSPQLTTGTYVDIKRDNLSKYIESIIK